MQVWAIQWPCKRDECVEGVDDGGGDGGGGGGGGGGIYNHPVLVGQTVPDVEETGSNEFVLFPAVTCDVGPPSTHITWNIKIM